MSFRCLSHIFCKYLSYPSLSGSPIDTAKYINTKRSVSIHRPSVEKLTVPSVLA